MKKLRVIKKRRFNRTSIVTLKNNECLIHVNSTPHEAMYYELYYKDKKVLNCTGIILDGKPITEPKKEEK